MVPLVGPHDWQEPDQKGSNQHNAHCNWRVVQGQAGDWVRCWQHKDYLQIPSDRGDTNIQARK